MAIVLVWAVGTVIVLAIALVTVKLGRERYRPSGTGPAVPTDEVLVDPETGRRQRVHMNPTTGARTYVDEPGPDRPG